MMKMLGLASIAGVILGGMPIFGDSHKRYDRYGGGVCLRHKGKNVAQSRRLENRKLRRIRRNRNQHPKSGKYRRGVR